MSMSVTHLRSGHQLRGCILHVETRRKELESGLPIRLEF